MNLQDEQEAMLTAALERKPKVNVPAGFSLRMRAAIAAEPARTAPKPARFSLTVAYVAVVSMAVFLIVLNAVAPRAIRVPESMSFILEMVIVTQLMAVGFWLGTRRES